MNERDVLNEFDALQEAISTSFIGGGEYNALCEELKKGQRLITAIESTGSSGSEGGRSKSNYKILFDGNPQEVPFSVFDGKKLCSSGCYITGVDDNESKASEVRRIRLYLSKECTGAQKKVDGEVTKYYYDLVWPTGKAGTDWTPPDPNKNPKHNYKKPIGDYTLAEVGCAGMSTSATGLAISGSVATVGVTGVSVSCSVAAFNFGFLLLKGIGLDYSVEALGTRSAAFAGAVEFARNVIKINELINRIINAIASVNPFGDDSESDDEEGG